MTSVNERFEDEESNADATEDTTTMKHTIRSVLSLAAVITAVSVLSRAAAAQNPRGSAEGPTRATGYDHPDQFLSAKEVKPAIFVDLPDVLVNLSNAGTDRTQYLKVKIVLEVPDAAIVAQIQPLMPRVMDAFQTYLRELPEDLQTYELVPG